MRRWVLLVVLVGLVAVPNAGAAVSTCAYNASAKVVTMTMVDEFGARVIREGNAIRYIAGGNELTCGAATVKNTKRIDIKGNGASADTIAANYVIVDLQGGPLAPGSKAEAKGKSEIEIRVAVVPRAPIPSRPTTRSRSRSSTSGRTGPTA